MNCPVSVALGENVPEAEKVYATKGTELHEQAARYLKWLMTEPFERSLSFDEELDPLVRVYTSSIVNQFEHRIKTGDLVKIYIEERLPFLGSSGGMDCYIVSENRAYLYDLKTGEGVKVVAKNNAQLAFYSCAIVENHPEVKSVTATIVQPSIEGEDGMPHVDTWELGPEDLSEWHTKFGLALAFVDHGLLGSEPKVGSYCQFCKAKPVCPAHMEVLEEVETNTAIEEISTMPVTADRIVYILKHKKHINSWLEKAEEYLFLRMKEGGPQADELVNAGCIIGKKRSYRRWKESLTDAQIIEALSARNVVSPAKTKPLSITEIEKLGVNIDDLVEKPEGEECLRLE
jgi:hypothetical protein